ncbi:MAG: hypothetical protein U9O96_05735 [Candidatus Thermoplasmatota archaeon]|nr:hypothetical protein [Candidatus Thermoplasmatota archaeon]
MKKIVIIVTVIIAVVVILLLSTGLSQDLHDVKERKSNDGEWNKKLGDSNHDESAMDIIQTDDGGYIIAGVIMSHGVWKGDVWLTKIDKEGNEIWSKTFGGREDDAGSSVIQADDGYVMAGYAHSYGKGEADYWLIKTDRSGNEEWNRTYGGKYDDFGMKVIKTKDRGYAIVGTTHSFNFPDDDIWIIKTDKEGNMLWNKTFGGNKTEFGDDIIEIEDGYLISGITYSYTTYGGWDIWLVKADRQGNEIWSKTYGWWDFEMNAHIIEVEEGYIIAGTTISTPTGWGDAYLIQIDRQGNEVWSKTYGGWDSDHVSSIKKTDDGYILAGATETYDVGNLFDAWLLKVDNNGNEVWNKSFGGRDREVANAVIPTKDGSYIIAGGTGQYPRDANAMVIKCADYSPPKINIVRPEENYLYLFDRELMPAKRTLILGSITVIAEVNDPMEKVDRVEFYLCHIGHKYELQPRAVVYSPPYEWKWNERVARLYEYEITAGVYYGNAGGVAADRIEVYIFNLFPISSPSVQAHAKNL